MYYSEEDDMYFNSLDDIRNFYKNKESPKIVYKCKSIDPNKSKVDALANVVLEFIDDCMLEFSNEDSYFSDYVTELEKDKLCDLLAEWIKSASVAVEPDFDSPVEF